MLYKRAALLCGISEVGSLTETRVSFFTRLNDKWVNMADHGECLNAVASWRVASQQNISECLAHSFGVKCEKQAWSETSGELCVCVLREVKLVLHKHINSAHSFRWFSTSIIWPWETSQLKCNLQTHTHTAEKIHVWTYLFHICIVHLRYCNLQ